MTALSAQSLTEKLWQIKSSIGSAPVSALTPQLLAEIDHLAVSFPIEFAELRASPKQLRFQRVFFDRRNPETGEHCDIFAAVGGNRSGKSYVCGWLCFAKFLRYEAKDGDWFWCVGQTLDRSVGGQQRELWQALPRWMFGSQTWDEKIGFGQHRKVVLPTSDGGKCLVEFRSADQDASTFEQAKLTGVWCDERLPEGIYDRLLPRIIDRNGWILYSDIPEQWWQFERLKEAAPGAGVFYQHFEMADNEHNLPEGAIAKASARMTSDERKLRIKGQYVVMEGVVYREFIDLFEPHGHLVRAFPGGIPKHWPRWRLIDYGGSAPTACLWVAIAPNEHVFCYREYYQANLSIAKNAAAILAMSGDEEYRATLMDPHAVDPPPVYYGAAKTISEQYEEAGIPSTGWPFVQVLGEHAMVQRVKLRLEHQTLWVYDTLKDLRREFRSWKYKCDSDGKPLASDAFESTNNHLLDGLKGFLGTVPSFGGQGYDAQDAPDEDENDHEAYEEDREPE